jgi:beta-lactamase class A
MGGSGALALAALDADLGATPGVVSVWCGRPGHAPAYARESDRTHYAASTMKLAVLAALHRRADAGEVDLDRPVPVRSEFTSVGPAGDRFSCRRDHDNDDEVWRLVGATATLRWLGERMVVRSSNLAANLVLDHVGLPAVAEVWRLAGARHSVTGRGIEDAAAAAAGITNLVTAADLAALLGTLATDALASPAACRAMRETLLRQRCGEDLATGLPPGTAVAHKNGWIAGVRHAAGLVLPEDAPAYVVVVCATTPLAVNRPGDEACRLVARVAAASWADRFSL